MQFALFNSSTNNNNINVINNNEIVSDTVKHFSDDANNGGQPTVSVSKSRLFITE